MVFSLVQPLHQGQVHLLLGAHTPWGAQLAAPGLAKLLKPRAISGENRVENQRRSKRNIEKPMKKRYKKVIKPGPTCRAVELLGLKKKRNTLIFIECRATAWAAWRPPSATATRACSALPGAAQSCRQADAGPWHASKASSTAKKTSKTIHLEPRKV